MFLRHVCPYFACAHLLDVSEGFDHGGKGLLHLVSPKHMFEWKKHPILPLKLTEGNLRLACSPAQSSAPTCPSNVSPSETPGYVGDKGNRSGKVWSCASILPKSWILMVSWGQLAHLVPLRNTVATKCGNKEVHEVEGLMSIERLGAP